MGTSTNDSSGAGERWWTKDRIATLRTLWESGKHDHEIAEHLGTTPRAIACKRHRVGLVRYYRNTSGKSRPTSPVEAKRELIEAMALIYSMCRSGAAAHEIGEVAREALDRI